jgi:MerR family mercuric resistance operon transcriptional regulator
MMRDQARFSVGTFAAAAGVNVETIRFYQRKGLLPEPTRPYGQIRRYGDADVARVKFVKSAQRLGFSLEEIAGLLQLEDGTHCDAARVMAEEKLEDVRAKLRDLRRIESTLRRLVADCCAAQGTITCPLIAALNPPTG